MSDILSLLRSIESDEYTDDHPRSTAKQAADEIERLQSQLDARNKEWSATYLELLDEAMANAERCGELLDRAQSAETRLDSSQSALRAVMDWWGTQSPRSTDNGVVLPAPPALVMQVGQAIDAVAVDRRMATIDEFDQDDQDGSEPPTASDKLCPHGYTRFCPHCDESSLATD